MSADFDNYRVVVDLEWPQQKAKEHGNKNIVRDSRLLFKIDKSIISEAFIIN